MFPGAWQLQGRTASHKHILTGSRATAPSENPKCLRVSWIQIGADTNEENVREKQLLQYADPKGQGQPSNQVNGSAGTALSPEPKQPSSAGS